MRPLWQWEFLVNFIHNQFSLRFGQISESISMVAPEFIRNVLMVGRINAPRGPLWVAAHIFGVLMVVLELAGLIRVSRLCVLDQVVGVRRPIITEHPIFNRAAECAADGTSDHSAAGDDVGPGRDTAACRDVRADAGHPGAKRGADIAGPERAQHPARLRVEHVREGGGDSAVCEFATGDLGRQSPTDRGDRGALQEAVG